MVMKRRITWTPHADYRYAMRFARHDIMREELEQEIEKQEFRIAEGYDKEYRTNKFKTIFPMRNKFATVGKAETNREIIILTLWESSEEEVKLWEGKK